MPPPHPHEHHGVDDSESGREWGWAEVPVAKINIEALALAPATDLGPERLSGDDVVRQVCLGVAEANAEFGSHYCVKKIAYLPSDTPPVDVYRELAKNIIQELRPGGRFANPPHPSSASLA